MINLGVIRRSPNLETRMEGPFNSCFIVTNPSDEEGFVTPVDIHGDPEKFPQLVGKEIYVGCWEWSDVNRWSWKENRQVELQEDQTLKIIIKPGEKLSIQGLYYIASAEVKKEFDKYQADTLKDSVSRAGYVTCIRQTYNTSLSWCKRNIVNEFSFQNLGHAQSAVAKGSRMTICPECWTVILDAVDKVSSYQSVKGEW